MQSWIIKTFILLCGISIFILINNQNFLSQENINSITSELLLFFIVYLRDQNEKQQFIHTFLQFKQLSLQQDVIDKLIPSSMIVLSRQAIQQQIPQPKQSFLFKQQLLDVFNKKFYITSEISSQNGIVEKSKNQSFKKDLSLENNEFQNLMTWDEIKLEYANQKCQDLFKTSQLSDIKSKLQAIMPFDKPQTWRQISNEDNYQQSETLLDDIILEISASSNLLKNQLLFPDQIQSYQDENLSYKDFEILEVMESKKNFIIEKQFFCAKYAICIWNNKPSILVLFINESLQKKNLHLQQLNEYKDKLLATVSHDLKTPLNCIISVTDYLKQQFSSDLQNSLNQIDLFSTQQAENYQTDIRNQHRLSLFSQNNVKQNLNSSQKCNSSQQSSYIQESIQPLNEFTQKNKQNEPVQSDDKKKQSLEYLQLIYNNSMMLLSMINDIIDYSKFNSKIKIKPNISRFILADVIQEVFDIFSFQVQSKQVKLILDSSCNINLTTDRNRIKQIIMNLVSNSQKFTLSGYIKVQATDNLDKNKIGISVEDTGIGMSNKILSQLFNDYATFNQENLNSNGIGLGLTICKKFVQMLGEGEGFQVQSEEGQGSKFYFEILQNYEQSDNYKQQNDVFNLIKDHNRGESPIKKFNNLKKVKNNISDKIKNINSQEINYCSTDEDLLKIENKIQRQNETIHNNQVLTNDNTLLQASSYSNYSGSPYKNCVKSIFVNQKMLISEINYQTKEQDDIPTELGQQQCINDSRLSIQSHTYVSSLVKRLSKQQSIEQDKIKQQINIMIVDDSQYNLLTLKLHLKQLNFFQVDEFLLAEEALKQFNSKDYDIIFSDIQMPIMDGLQFVKQIRQQGPLIHQPLVVLVSADTEDKYEEEMKGLSISGFINKPIIDKTKFSDLLSSLVEQI